MGEKYIRVEDIRKVCDPTKDHDVPMLKLVRCKDCQHFVCDDPTYCHCYLDGRSVWDDDYCSRAEEVDDGV